MCYAVAMDSNNKERKPFLSPETLKIIAFVEAIVIVAILIGVVIYLIAR